MEGVEGGARVMHGVPCGAMGECADGDVWRMLEEDGGGEEKYRVVATRSRMEGGHGGFWAMEAGKLRMQITEASPS